LIEDILLESAAFFSAKSSAFLARFGILFEEFQ
jgi:hypothetical protein